MPLGPIESVRVFTRDLSRARRFYSGVLGLSETLADEAVAIFATGQAKLIIEQVHADDPEASGLVGRFTAFLFTVADMAATIRQLAPHAIDWVSQSERQTWGGILSHLKDPDGNILTLVQYS